MPQFYLLPITDSLSQKVKIKITLEKVIKARKGLEVYLYSFFNLGSRWGWVVNSTPRPLYPWEKDPVPIA